MKIQFSVITFFVLFFYNNSNATDIYISSLDPAIETLRIEQAVKKEFTKSSFTRTAKKSGSARFFISLNEKEPLYVHFILNDSLYTEVFYLDMSVPRIDITIKKDLGLEIKNSKAQDEYLGSYVQALQPINTEISSFFSGEYRDIYIRYNGQIPDSISSRFDSIRAGMRERRFVAITDYIIAHSDSYVAMWELLLEILTYGYKEKLAKAYSQFSDKLKRSAVGKLVNAELQQALALEPGKPFPKFLVNSSNLSGLVELNNSFRSKYTLIDFWFSKCYPCIDQFQTLKSIQGSYPRDEFEIISVSTDTEKNIEDWKQAVIKHDLPFAQYIDIGGTETHSKLNIGTFPNNYLLDSTGKIIAKKITLNQLKEFLQIHLK